MQLPETLGKPMTETVADFEKLYLQNPEKSTELESVTFLYLIVYVTMWQSHFLEQYLCNTQTKQEGLMSGRDDGNIEVDKNGNLMKDLPETDI